MKARKESALRSKRGLHHGRGAEPQVVGRTPQTTNDRSTDTMKTYLLREPKTVEPQNARRAAVPARPPRGAYVPVVAANRPASESAPSPVAEVVVS